MSQVSISLGPIHTWLPGMMKLDLELTGDRIDKVTPEFGYTHRDIMIRVREESLSKAQRIFSRIEPESSMILDRIWCEAIEQAAEAVVSDRAKWIRSISTEMNELLAALKFLFQMARQLNLPALENVILKHREELLDLNERLTGSRFGYDFIVLGGTRFDITDGFLERMEKWCKNLRQDHPRIDALFHWTHPIQYRLNQVGVIPPNQDYGFLSSTGFASSVGSRIRHVLSEILEMSLSIEEQVTQKAPTHNGPAGESPFRAAVQIDRAKKKKSKVLLETLRGNWALSIEMSARAQIDSIELSTPSDLIRPALPVVLEGAAFDDLPLILQSTFFLVTEVDR